MIRNSNLMKEERSKMMRPTRYRTTKDRNRALLAEQERVDRALVVKNETEKEYEDRKTLLEDSLKSSFMRKLLENQSALVNLMGKFYGHNLHDQRAVLLMKGKSSLRFDKNWDNLMKDSEWSIGDLGYVYNTDYSWLPYTVRQDTIRAVNEHGVILEFGDVKYLVPFAFLDANVSELTQFFRKRRDFFIHFVEKPEAFQQKKSKLNQSIAQKREAMALMQKEIEELEKQISPDNLTVHHETEPTHE